MDTDLLVIKSSQTLTKKQQERLQELALDIGDELGMMACVLDKDLDVEIHRDFTEVVSAMAEQTAAINELINLNSQMLMALADMEDVEEPPQRFLDDPA